MCEIECITRPKRTYLDTHAVATTSDVKFVTIWSNTLTYVYKELIPHIQYMFLAFKMLVKITLIMDCMVSILNDDFD